MLDVDTATEERTATVTGVGGRWSGREVRRDAGLARPGRCAVLLLAIDTSTTAITVAVHDDAGSTPAVGATLDARAHAEHLAPPCATPWPRPAPRPADLTDVVVGIGPGPFTGLRVGLVTARTLGHALGIPVHGLMTLDALAHEALAERDAGTTCSSRPTPGARRSTGPRYARGDRRGRGAHRARLSTARRSSPTTCARCRPRVAAPVLYPDLIPDGRSASARRRPGRGWPAGRACAASAAGEPMPVEPLYLRRPDALTPPSEVDVGDAVTAPSTLREARGPTSPALAALERELFADDAWSEATWWTELAGRPRRDYVVLADADGTSLGYAGLDLGGDVADVMTIAVGPAGARAAGSGGCCSTSSCAGRSGARRGVRAARGARRQRRGAAPLRPRRLRGQLGAAGATTSPATSTRWSCDSC